MEADQDKCWVLLKNLICNVYGDFQEFISGPET